MVVGIPLTVTYGRISSFFKSNERQVAASLVNLASGNRVRKPQDNIPDFFHAQRLNRDSHNYRQIAHGIAEASALIDVASQAGEIVYNSIHRMKDLVNLYYNGVSSDEEKVRIQREFDSLAEQVTTTVNNSTYNGKRLIQDTGPTPLQKVNLSPDDISLTFDISFTANHVPDVSGLTLGTADQIVELEAVQNELDKAGSYLATAHAYKQGLRAQGTIASRKIRSSSTTAGMITNGDTGTAMLQSMNASIRQQSSLAMMAQANLFRSSVLRLFQ